MRPKEDKFQETITKLVSLYYREKRKFYYGIAGIVAVIVILIILFQGRGRENPEVHLRFTEALGLYSTNNFDPAIERFTELSRRFSSHPLGVKAYFYLGNIFYSTERFDEARRAFETFYKKNKKDPILSPAALLGIANASEELQELLKAGQTYEEVYKRYKKSPLAVEALFGAGRCYRNLGNYKKAEEIYETILKANPTGELAEKAKVERSFVKTLQEKF